MKQQIEMTLKKSVVHSHVYEAKDSMVPTIYIKKDGLPTLAPLTITITVEYDEPGK